MAPSPSRSRRGFLVVSVTSPATARALFQAIARTSKAHNELRGAIFKEIARNSELQHQLLRVLAKRPKLQRRIIIELAKNPKFRRKLTVFAQPKD